MLKISSPVKQPPHHFLGWQDVCFLSFSVPTTFCRNFYLFAFVSVVFKMYTSKARLSLRPRGLLLQDCLCLIVCSLLQWSSIIEDDPIGELWSCRTECSLWLTNQWIACTGGCRILLGASERIQWEKIVLALLSRCGRESTVASGAMEPWDTAPKLAFIREGLDVWCKTLDSSMTAVAVVLRTADSKFRDCCCCARSPYLRNLLGLNFNSSFAMTCEVFGLLSWKRGRLSHSGEVGFPTEER